MLDYLIISLFFLFFVFLIVFGIINKRKSNSSIGKSPIKKHWFVISKLLMFAIWIIAILKAFHINFSSFLINVEFKWTGVIIVFIGIVIIILAFLYLGKYTKFGLAEGESELITQGIYKYSRNPMYIALFLMVLGSILYSIDWISIILAIISIFLHHKIVLGEEKYLSKYFNGDWEKYKNKTRRYI